MTGEPERGFSGGGLLAVVGAVTVSAYVLIGRSLRHRVALGSYLTGVYAAATRVLGLTCRALGVRDTAWGWYAGTAGVGAGTAWMAREEWQRRRSLGVSN